MATPFVPKLVSSIAIAIKIEAGTPNSKEASTNIPDFASMSEEDTKYCFAILVTVVVFEIVIE